MRLVPSPPLGGEGQGEGEIDEDLGRGSKRIRIFNLNYTSITPQLHLNDTLIKT